MSGGPAGDVPVVWLADPAGVVPGRVVAVAALGCRVEVDLV